MNSILKRLSPLDLMMLAAVGGDDLRASVEDQLDRRAAAALVRRILQGARASGGSEAQFAQSHG